MYESFNKSTTTITLVQAPKNNHKTKFILSLKEVSIVWKEQQIFKLWKTVSSSKWNCYFLEIFSKTIVVLSFKFDVHDDDDVVCFYFIAALKENFEREFLLKEVQTKY